MSIPYGASPYGTPPYGGQPGGVAPTYKYSFGWISESWNIFSRAAGVWIGAVLIYGAVQYAFSLVMSLIFGVGNPNTINGMNNMPPPTSVPSFLHLMSEMYPPFFVIVITLFSWVFTSFMFASLFGMALKQLRGQPISIGDAFGGGPNLGKMLVFYILGSLLYTLGAIALIIGIFVAIAILIPAAAMVADGEPAPSAISRAFEGGKRDLFTGSLFAFVYVLIVIVSELPCLLGLMATVPMFYIIGALAYRDLVGMPGAMPPSSPMYNAGTPGYGQGAPGQWPPAPGQAPTYGQPGGYNSPGQYGQPSGPNPPGQYGQQPQAPYGQPQPPGFGNAPQPPYGQPGGQQQPPPAWQPPGNQPPPQNQ